MLHVCSKIVEWSFKGFPKTIQLIHENVYRSLFDQASAYMQCCLQQIPPCKETNLLKCNANLNKCNEKTARTRE